MAKEIFLLFNTRKYTILTDFLWSRNPGIKMPPIPGFLIGKKGWALCMCVTVYVLCDCVYLFLKYLLLVFIIILHTAQG